MAEAAFTVHKPTSLKTRLFKNGDSIMTYYTQASNPEYPFRIRGIRRVISKQERINDGVYNPAIAWIDRAYVDVAVAVSVRMEEVLDRSMQVRTVLENPTRYHVIQKQKTQVRLYLSESFQQSEWENGSQSKDQNMDYTLGSNSNTPSDNSFIGVNSMRPNMPPPSYVAKMQMQSQQNSKPKSHSMQSMQPSTGSNSYHQTQTQASSNRSSENINSNNNGSNNGMSSYFQNRYACGINASPESAMSPSISSVATSTSEYTRGFGHLRLVQAISKLYTQLVNRPIDPLNEVLITSGAYEALYSAIQGHVDKGDEVIIIEPFFDCYEPMVKMAGGIPRFIPLKPKNDKVTSSADWVLDFDELENMFNNKTKMFILNNPNNPLGKVFTANELKKIAALCVKYNVLCLSDEVYEWMTYDGNEHIRICMLDGMWERTITIGSAGKTFSVTGWKIGWAYAPSNLIVNMQMVHQNSVYTCTTPIQEALAIAFETEIPRLTSQDCYFNSLPEELRVKRNFMSEFLTKVGMNVTIPEGGYFLMADWTPLADKCDLSSETDVQKDYRFTKWMSKNLGLQGIPPSAFYSVNHKHLGENNVRYCFFKKDENLQAAANLLANWRKP